MSAALLTVVMLLVMFALLGSGLWVAFALLGVGLFGMAIATQAPLGAVLATTSWGARWQDRRVVPVRSRAHRGRYVRVFPGAARARDGRRLHAGS